LADLTRREWLLLGSAAAFHIMNPAMATTTPSQHRIRLSLNENPFGPSPKAVEAIKADLSDLSRYTGDELDTLTDAIAAHENIGQGCIVIGEILDSLGLYLSAQGGPGGEFIYSEPGYTALVDAVAPAGGVVVGVPLNDKLENDLPALAAKVNDKTRAVYLVNPHNPTGTVSDAIQFIDFVRELSRRTFVIVDEAYLEFAPDFAQRTVSGLVREGAQVAVFRTFEDPRARGAFDRLHASAKTARDVVETNRHRRLLRAQSTEPRCRRGELERFRLHQLRSRQGGGRARGLARAVPGARSALLELPWQLRLL
jgi:histidinol-phosphate aminotransferase